MKIKPIMVNWLEVMKAIPKEKEEGLPVGALLPVYMEYPPIDKKQKYVIQWHIRGRSVHLDWRMEVNDHLVGWTVLAPGGIPKAAETVEEGKKAAKETSCDFRADVKNKGLRAEVKARQPKIWLTVEGIVKPGEVGATKEYPGVFVIVDQGYVHFGAQKPYFHEYFLKSTKKDGYFDTKDWTRVVVRAVNVQVIDPETKKPKPGTELMWRVMVPGDQTPYALERGWKKKWIPPKGYIPIPQEWRKGDKYEEWLKWVKEAWATGKKTPKEEEEKTGAKDLEQEITETALAGTKANFTVHYLSYMGQIVVRGIPNQMWFLRLEEDGKVYSWEAEIDFTRFSPAALAYEGIVDKKWISYEGDIPPNSKYNPTKTLTAKMRIIDKGTCTIKKETISGEEVRTVTFHGKLLTDKWILKQEEKGSPMYTLEKLSKEELEEATFVLQLHEIETPEGLKAHHDVRISKGFEFNIWCNPLDLKEEGQSCKANYKACRQIEKWINIDKPKTKMMVGDLVTYVTPIDEGKVSVIEYNPPRFISMLFEGEKLKGYFVYIEKDAIGSFERAKLPHPLSAGDPSKGDYYKPFKEIRKQGWDYFWLEIYDQKAFSRCVEDPTKYIPELKNVPPEVQEVLVCLYPRPGTIHGARVSRIKFSDKWTVTQASDWIQKKKLHTWEGELIREKRKSTEEEIPSEDEMLRKIIEEELKRREKTPEERRIELELKKKKLELIERWLEAQKE